VALVLQLKGSLFDEEAIGTIEVSAEVPPEIGDVVECKGKSYTVTDLIGDGLEVFGSVASGASAPAPSFVAIVEPLAVSQRRGPVSQRRGG